jgi:hypothetical protein
LLGVDGESYIVDQSTIVGVFCTTHVCPFCNDVPNNIPIEEKVKEDLPPAIATTPNTLPMQPRIKIRIPRRTKEELERGLVKCLPLPDADTFMVSLPPTASNDEFDPRTLDWRNVDFTKSRREELNGLLKKQVFEVVSKEAALGKRIYGSCFVDKIKY